MPEMVAKVAEVRRMLDGLGSSAWLEVDGGISVETISRVYEAGADAFVAAHAIFEHPDGIAAGIAALRNAV
jgi:ribulose-phosphate 3-epimerase